MALAALMATWPDELACDMAETYRIYDLHAFPARYIATLAEGLRSGSRIWAARHGAKEPLPTLLLARISDAVEYLLTDGQAPRLLPDMLKASESVQDGDGAPEVFDSPEAYEAARAKHLSEEASDDG